MLRMRGIASFFCVTFLSAIAVIAHSQAYPQKAIRFVTTSIGGGNDLLTRAIAQGITGPLGQPVVIDNRPSDLLGEIISKAPPDGYTLLFGGASLWILPFMQTVHYDPVKDMSPVTLVEKSPRILVVSPSLPVKSVQDLIAYAKAKPGELNNAYSAAGSRLAAELFKAMTGANFVNVPYSSNSQLSSDLVGSRVHMTFASTAFLPLLKSGKLRGLAVTTAGPSALVPGLPTVAATLPGYETAAMAAVFVPTKTPKEIVNRLNKEMVRVLRQPDVIEKFASAGSEAVSSSPEEAELTIKNDMTSLGKIIKDTGMRVD